MNSIKLYSCLSLCFFIASCSHTQLHKDLVFESKKITVEEEFDFSNPKTLEAQIKELGSLRKVKTQDKLVRILIAFHQLTKKIDGGYIYLVPNTKTTVEVSSFCASSSKAIPEAKEVFRWKKGLPKITFVRKVLDLYSRSHIQDKKDIQELLWNLDNGTYYEDYPKDLKAILTKVSPSASIILPSRAKNEVIDYIIPDEIKDSLSLVRGKYYSFREFQKIVSELKSKETIPPNYFATKIPDKSIVVSTKSNGFKSQYITYYNNSSKIEVVNLRDYYLEPVRKDVQPIVLASVIPNIEELNKVLDKASKKALGYLAFQYPTLNSAEKELVKKKPREAFVVLRKMLTAEGEAERRFPGSGMNGDSDAFRHFVWAGLLVRDLGEATAREFLNAHETQPGQPAEQKEMDNYNNEQGIKAAKTLLKNGAFSDLELFEAAQTAIKKNRLKILNYKSR